MMAINKYYFTKKNKIDHSFGVLASTTIDVK